MKIVHRPAELAPFSRQVCIAIGVFDGVHLGHQQILRQTVADAQQRQATPMAITFDRHPSAIVAPERAVSLIYPLSQKLHVLGTQGIEFTLLIRFDQTFSAQSGEDYVRQLAAELGQIESICVGSDFAFGRNRTGNVSLLQSLGQELGFEVRAQSAISLDGTVVSSTRIREAIRQGHFETASQMLGRPYALHGRVVPGDQLGRTLGFPTANLDSAGLVLPPQGVYAGEARVGGQSHASVLNIGRRPTLANADSPLRAEAHLLDFSGDLYGRELEFRILRKLRDEIQFPSLSALQEQITRDIGEARAVLKPSG